MPKNVPVTKSCVFYSFCLSSSIVQVNSSSTDYYTMSICNCFHSDCLPMECIELGYGRVMNPMPFIDFRNVCDIISRGSSCHNNGKKGSIVK